MDFRFFLVRRFYIESGLCTKSVRDGHSPPFQGGRFAKRTGWFVKSRSHLVDNRAAHLIEKRRLRGIVWWLRDFNNHSYCFTLSRSRFAPGVDAPPLF